MKAWMQLSGELASATGRNFERLVLPLLQLSWPTLFRPPDRDELDKAGIDLAADFNGFRLGCVVQCKGFYAADSLTRDHLAQIRGSIDSFLQSRFTTDEYVLLHNRDSRDQEVGELVKTELARLTKAGKAKTARLWDRHEFIHDLKRKVRGHVIQEMGIRSSEHLQKMSQLFHFGNVYLPRIPVSEQELVFRRGEVPKLLPAKPPEVQELFMMISDPSNARWTLLTGIYGAGKSTAVLHAVGRGNRMIIYARCSDLHFRDGGVGTNLLMETILESFGLFSEWESEHRAKLLRLSGTMLRAALENELTEASLILDGLDENRIFATPHGMMTLSSLLAELRCSILLTTREEHFRATFANFDTLVANHSTKGGGGRHARVLRLEPWGDGQVIEFLSEVLKRHGGGGGSVGKLIDSLRAGEVAPNQVELLRHPFFLQMIAELAAEGEEVGHTRASVLSRWTRFKIARDLEADRPLPSETHDREEYTQKITRAMQEISRQMVEPVAGGFLLTETIPANLALKTVEVAFGNVSQTLATITSASLLTPTLPSETGQRSLKFSHRAFQEYFLARHLVESKQPADAYPPEVQDLHSQLLSE